MYQNKQQLRNRENTLALVSVSMMFIGFIWLGVSVTAIINPGNQIVLNKAGEK